MQSRTVDEVIPFRRPEWGRIVLSDLEPRVNTRDIEETFGTLGLIHNTILYKNEGKCVYALVTYYSDNCARAAEKKRDGVKLRGRPVKVKRVKTKFTWPEDNCALASSQVGIDDCDSTIVLSYVVSECVQLIQLANHFLGFNGWSCEIVRMEPYQGESTVPAPAMPAVQCTSQWICGVVVTLKDGRTCSGTGVGEGQGRDQGTATKVSTSSVSRLHILRLVVVILLVPSNQMSSLVCVSLHSLRRNTR
jgi:hypothetical protein